MKALCNTFARHTHRKVDELFTDTCCICFSLYRSAASMPLVSIYIDFVCLFVFYLFVGCFSLFSGVSKVKRFRFVCQAYIQYVDGY